jgi:hypothetical protein
MQVRVWLQITADDGEAGDLEEIVAWDKTAVVAEDVGLSLAQGKDLLSAAQRRIVEAQTTAWIETRRCCEDCGRRAAVKDRYPIVYHTLFGDVALKSPRFQRCKCRGDQGPATWSPLGALIPLHIAPERSYLEARWASLVPYAAAADLMADFLPIAAGANASTVRRHVLKVAERLEGDLPDDRCTFMDGAPRDWADLPIPDGRVVVGLDGGYVRDWDQRKNNFEVIVGRSMPQDGPSRYLGFVHGHDRKPKRRLMDLLESQGVQANQDITFLTDGGKEILTLTDRISPCSEHVLDWFHITMKITVLGQFVKGVSALDEQAGARLAEDLARIKWKLWHGAVFEVGDLVENFEDDVANLEVDYPNLKKFETLAGEFGVYIKSNADSIINYGERYRAGERISSAFVEATVNAVASKRFAKKQQMQWTRKGAHLLMQTRTRTLDGTLRSTFEKWYPGMANDNSDETVLAEAA